MMLNKQYKLTHTGHTPFLLENIKPPGTPNENEKSISRAEHVNYFTQRIDTQKTVGSIQDIHRIVYLKRDAHVCSHAPSLNESSWALYKTIRVAYILNSVSSAVACYTW